MDTYRAPCRAFLCIPLLIGLIFTWGCAPGDAGSPVLTAEMPLHLEEHLDAASIVGSEVPADVPQSVGSESEPLPKSRGVTSHENDKRDQRGKILRSKRILPPPGFLPWVCQFGEVD